LLLGAGTALEVLRKVKPLIIVTNDHLMDNHQKELALELAESKFAVCSNPMDLPNALRSFNVSALQPFPKCEPQRFGNFITKLYRK